MDQCKRDTKASRGNLLLHGTQYWARVSAPLWYTESLLLISLLKRVTCVCFIICCERVKETKVGVGGGEMARRKWSIISRWQETAASPPGEINFGSRRACNFASGAEQRTWREQFGWKLLLLPSAACAGAICNAELMRKNGSSAPQKWRQNRRLRYGVWWSNGAGGAMQSAIISKLRQQCERTLGIAKTCHCSRYVLFAVRLLKQNCAFLRVK